MNFGYIIAFVGLIASIGEIIRCIKNKKYKDTIWPIITTIWIVTSVVYLRLYLRYEALYFNLN